MKISKCWIHNQWEFKLHCIIFRVHSLLDLEMVPLLTSILEVGRLIKVHYINFQGFGLLGN